MTDDSGSMAFEEGGERIDDMKAVLGRTADAATLFDTDGIVVRSEYIILQNPNPLNLSPNPVASDLSVHVQLCRCTSGKEA